MKLNHIALISASLALFASPSTAILNAPTAFAKSAFQQIKIVKSDYYYNKKGQKVTYHYQGNSYKRLHVGSVLNLIKTVKINGETYYYIGNNTYLKASACQLVKPVKKVNKKSASSSNKKSTKKSANSSKKSVKKSATKTSTKKARTNKSNTSSSKKYLVLAEKSYEFNSKGERANKNVLLKGHSYRFYSTKKIKGELYYAVNPKETLFVKDSSVKKLDYDF